MVRSDGPRSNSSDLWTLNLVVSGLLSASIASVRIRCPTVLTTTQAPYLRLKRAGVFHHLGEHVAFLWRGPRCSMLFHAVGAVFSDFLLDSIDR